MRMVRTDIRAVEFLSPRSPARQAIEHLDQVYGGINVVQVEFDTGRTNGINDLAVLRYLEAVHREAERRPEFTGVFSYPLLLAMMNQLWKGERPGTLRLPEQPWLVQLFVLALRRYEFPFLTALADPTCRTAYLVLRTSDLPADRYLELIRDIVRFAEAQCPPGVTVSAARGLHSILEADRRILRNQLGSAGLTFVVIGGVLALLWRSPGLAAVALVANAVPVAFVIALAGFLRVPLNSITVMVGAISLGIAVDNAIHFITHWRTERRKGASAAVAAERTLRVKGRPILYAQAILIAVFGVFWCSSFPPVVHFGLLSAGAFVGGLAGVLIFLPAVLSRCR
jgi:predicted RND superfamily exporter protein